MDVEALYDQHFGRLVRLATGWLGDRDAAEDVAQAALIAAYTALGRGVCITRLDAWLTRVARNLAVSQVRRQVRHQRLGTTSSPSALVGRGSAGPLVDPADVAEQRERLDEVLAAVLLLPARFRDDLLLCLRTAGPAEAATSRGLTVGAWHARLVRAREALRLALAPPATVELGSLASVADRRRAVAELHARGRRPAAIARLLRLPRRTVISDLAVLRRRSPAVVLLRQLLLFGDDGRPDSAGQPAPPGWPRTGRAAGAPRPATRRRQQATRPAEQLALPL